ncbi:MAG: response regulator transcription factor [Acidobacteriota bacterium]
MSRKIRVLLADEHDEGQLSELVNAQEDMELIGRVTKGELVVTEACRLGPDVVVLDLSLPGAGLRALEQIADVRPNIRVVVLAMHEEITLLRTVLAIGSLGYVVQRSARPEVLTVIRKMHAGRGYMDVPTGGLPIDPAAEQGVPINPEIQEKLDMLSKRESEVLRAVAYGWTNREIAERIGISVKSIETYRYRVSEKLNFNSRADLVRFALEAGLLMMGGEGLPDADV